MESIGFRSSPAMTGPRRYTSIRSASQPAPAGAAKSHRERRNAVCPAPFPFSSELVSGGAADERAR
jgi:hypothetical protein